VISKGKDLEVPLDVFRQEFSRIDQVQVPQEEMEVENTTRKNKTPMKRIPDNR
jgi:hypothetical protein